MHIRLPRQLHCAEFHPDGVTVAVAGRDSAVRVYDMRSKRLLQEYNAHEGMVNSMHFHPSGNYLVTGASDSLTRVFDVLRGRLLYTLVTHMKPVHAVCFSHSGEHFATGGDDCQVILWKSCNADLTREEKPRKDNVRRNRCGCIEPVPTARPAKPMAVVHSAAQPPPVNQCGRMRAAGDVWLQRRDGRRSDRQHRVRELGELRQAFVGGRGEDHAHVDWESL
ncbi:hypothetical protein HPB50_020092 [Hyalomma asiaticum]|uniref:Uncharacterized protein n=1 Tax=Hyalomma asiaticum TaxID=266040 RepID=A0ACB7RN89_HYAAI|nr:hypothetical protein HPB50_020092 [Hyalomma asiaticum]